MMLQTAQPYQDAVPSDPLSQAYASRDADVLKLVRDALVAERGELAFHPIVLSNDTRRICFYEGLIRLRDDRGRLIPAAHFMPQIEESDLGRQMDAVSLRLALNTLRGDENLRLSVNVSARSFGDGRWRRILDEGLRQRGRLGERLIFEITEKSAMQLHELVTGFIEDMQPHGVNFSLDGFGGGLISFRHLRQCLFDMAKIDKSVVSAIDRDPDNQVIAETLVMIAKQFDMFTIADGVETGSEAAFLQGVGVDCLQGYRFGLPRSRPRND